MHAHSNSGELILILSDVQGDVQEGPMHSRYSGLIVGLWTHQHVPKVRVIWWKHNPSRAHSSGTQCCTILLARDYIDLYQQQCGWQDQWLTVITLLECHHLS